MSKREKLIQRFNSNPKDFTFEELVRLMSYYGYKLDKAGKTSGSRTIFNKNNEYIIEIHRPHSYKCLLPASIKFIREKLKENEDDEKHN